MKLATLFLKRIGENFAVFSVHATCCIISEKEWGKILCFFLFMKHATLLLKRIVEKSIYSLFKKHAVLFLKRIGTKSSFFLSVHTICYLISRRIEEKFNFFLVH